MTIWDVLIVLLIGALILGVGALLGSSIAVTSIQAKEKDQGEKHE